MTAARLPYANLAPQAVASLAGVHQAVNQSTLEPVLVDLVYLRVSQLNGCAFCVDMHWRDLLRLGDDPQRLNNLCTWREVSFFSPREQAAMAWAESLTLLHKSHDSDADFDALRPHFNDSEIAHLNLAIASINAWNRIGVGMRMQVEKKAISL